ncbi:MAG: patatin family protein [Clostridia bacterium]|nr:patatin family protein [Clostridia bacterium]
MKTGLILEGGAMRGMFTAGVMDVMMEAGIRFDGAIGVSAGAAFGCNYKSGQIGRVIRYNTRFCADKRYSGLRILLREGNLYSTDFCYREVPLVHDVFDFDAYRKNPMEFYVVCTDVETGKPVYHLFEGNPEDAFDWIRASASMPLVSQIVEVGGYKLLDGGISDSIPVRAFQQMGYDRNVVVLTQPEGYRKKKNPLIPLMRLFYRRYPAMVDTMARRHTEYNAALDDIRAQEQAGSLLVIRPEVPLVISKTEKDPEKLREIYNLGRKAAEARLDDIRAFTEA